MVSKASNSIPLPERLSELELSDLLAFNSQVAKLSTAGVPIRFAGAPNSISDWLEGISHRAAVNVGLGQTAFTALGAEPSIHSEYIAALIAWLDSRSLDQTPTCQGDAVSGSLKVLDPWVQSGLKGNRLVDKSALYAFWLWIVALMASVVLLHSAWVMFPKLQKFYENSGLQIGIGYRWLEWIYNRLPGISIALATLLMICPLLWRLWFHRIAKHWDLPNYFARGFFIAYLVFGGLLTAGLGWTVFWPVIELLLSVGEPHQ